MAKDFDLLLSLFPFERDWYAKRVPELRVEFVGNPLVDRYGPARTRARTMAAPGGPTILLLPGSRPGELKRHLPVLLEALARMRAVLPQVRPAMVLPSPGLVAQAKQIGLPEGLNVQVGDLAGALEQADLAIASTGTVTLECAYFGVPAIALYKTSWVTWQIAKRIATVKYGAMPNLIANREIFPEFIQDAATADNISRAALDLLRNEPRRQQIKNELAEVVASLGPPGAAARAARIIMETLAKSQLPDQTRPIEQPVSVG